MEKTDTHLGSCFIPISKLTTIYLPEKAPYLNPNERNVNQQIKSCVCANRLYEYIHDQKEFLDNRFGRWNNDGI